MITGQSKQQLSSFLTCLKTVFLFSSHFTSPIPSNRKRPQAFSPVPSLWGGEKGCREAVSQPNLIAGAVGLDSARTQGGGDVVPGMRDSCQGWDHKGAVSIEMILYFLVRRISSELNI